MIKFLQILLIAAIYNPLCCCDAVMGYIEEEKEPVSHACCGGQQGKPDQENDSHHDRDDCPHRVGNGYQQASWDNLKFSETGVQPVEFPVLEDFVHQVERPAENTSVRVVNLHAGSRSPPDIQRVNCVYLI